MSWSRTIKKKLVQGMGNTIRRMKADLKEDSTPARYGRAMGETIGRGIVFVGSAIKERYNRKYGGGEYREARIKEYESRAREASAKAKLVKARANLKKNQKGSFRPARDLSTLTGNNKGDYSFITGDKNKKSDYSFITGKR